MNHRFPSFVAPLALALTTAANVYAQDDQASEDNKVETSVTDPIGYFLGLSIGQQMRQNGFRPDDIDMKALLAGFGDGMTDTECGLE